MSETENWSNLPKENTSGMGVISYFPYLIPRQPNFEASLFEKWKMSFETTGNSNKISWTKHVHMFVCRQFFSQRTTN